MRNALIALLVFSLMAMPAWAFTSKYGGTSDVTLSTDVTGTANQVTVTDDGDGTVTLSTPQDIGTASTPTFLNTVTGAGYAVSNSTGSEDTGLCIFDGTSGRVLKGATLGPRYDAGVFKFSTGSAARDGYSIQTDQGTNAFHLNTTERFKFYMTNSHSTSGTPAADFSGAMGVVNPDGRQCTGSSATQSIWHVAGNNNQSGTARFALYSGYMTNTAGGSGGSYFVLYNTPTTSAGITDAGDFVSNGNTGITNSVTIPAGGCQLDVRGGVVTSLGTCTGGAL